jgi:gas vesicle protein
VSVSPFLKFIRSSTKKHNMNSTKVITGIIAGFAAGAVLGILFAPEKGSVTRQKISDKSDEYADDLKFKYDELRESVKGKMTDAKQAAKDLANKGKEAFAGVKEEAEHLTWEAKNAAKQNFNV